MATAELERPGTYETVIGLECHVELSTRSKMFCGCRNEFGAPPNTNVCPVCLGLPGSLPVPNRAAIEAIVRIGLALECEIAPDSLFHRKNYFYPDMPKDYQISQYDLPVCVGGRLEIDVDGSRRAIGITRVHMEEDTGKTTHVGAGGRIGSAEYALVDYNRAGVPLVEIVSEPDMRSPEEARTYFSELRSTLEALGVSDVRMEEGSLRCDANVSTRRPGESALGTKVEIKNLNSVRSLERALRFEEQRQRAALDAGQPLVQETRHFDEAKGTTHTLRSKEEAFDYRYFPEPDLPPLAPDRPWVEELRTSLPELPAARRDRYRSALHLTPEQARILAGAPASAAFFEEVVALGADPPAAANWVTQDLAGLLNTAKVEIPDAKVTPQHLADVVRLVSDGTISATGAKQVLEEAFETGEPAETIVERLGLRQVTDASALERWVDEAIAENPEPVQQFRGGKEGALNAVLGQVMKKSGGSANPKAVRELLLQRLSGS
jgi:aspartyl-tRNA(Asn)/glutamyl-tRNA(Gln) amidotransferase subunit B